MDSKALESICSDSREGGASGPKACFLGGKPLLVSESSAGIFTAVIDCWWPSGKEQCEENESAMIAALIFRDVIFGYWCFLLAL